MKKQNNTNRIFSRTFIAICVVIFGLLANTTMAQSDRSLYFLPILPNARTVNPAIFPQYNFYIGVPFLSSVKFGFENSFNYDHVFLKKGDSLYLDRDHLLSNLKDNNFANFNLSEEILTFGVKAGKNYFNFRVADLLNANVHISKEFLKFFLYGNGSEEYLGKNVDLGGNSLNITYHREFSLGYTRQVTKKLNLGVNLKYLMGIANLNTEKLDFNLYTDPVDFAISGSSNIRVFASSPVPEGEDFKPEHIFINTGNQGFAFDIGGQYMFNEKWTFGASLLEIGSINWNKNVTSFITEDPDKVVTFEGFDILEFIDDNSLDGDRIEEILDSIGDEFGIEEGEVKYKTSIPSTLMLNVHYNLGLKNQFSGVMSTQFLQNRAWPALSLAYTRKFSKSVNLMFSYSAFPHSYLNVGAGFAANLGPVQFYLIAENFIAPMMLTQASLLQVRFGISLVFGEKKKVEDPVETPKE